MSIGQHTLDWLRTELLQVDAAWLEHTSRGFRWWPHRQAQTLEVIGQEVTPDGVLTDLVQVRTELLSDFNPTDETLEVLQAVVLRTAGMAGAVHDPVRHTLDLSTLVRVSPGSEDWLQRLLGLAAVLQIRDAERGATAIAEVLGARPADSAHPTRGQRETPDARIAEAILLIDQAGRTPSRWPGAELERLAETELKRSPALQGTGDAQGFRVTFPYGAGMSSSCEATTDQTHPWYGHGLAMRQVFPVSFATDAAGRRLALELNARTLCETPMGYGFGSFGYARGALLFHAFYDVVEYR
ncbi:MAG: hypothetical protein EOM91_19110, partial [Sphingobacteriia bacterium]|nr:hypothetical protein [Sphingobacteriia bacterium]